MIKHTSPYDVIRGNDSCGWSIIVECYGVKRKFSESNKRFRQRVINGMKKLYPLYKFDEKI